MSQFENEKREIDRLVLSFESFLSSMNQFEVNVPYSVREKLIAFSEIKYKALELEQDIWSAQNTIYESIKSESDEVSI